MSTPRLALVAAALLSAVSSNVAFADDIAAAKMHYERGTTLFDLQRYSEAAKEYEAAFEAKNDPALLFNIAQAYRFAGDYAKAIAAYRSYLRRVPEADNRAEIDRRILELQKLSDEQKRNQSTPPTGTLKPGEQPTPEPASSSAEPQVQATAPQQPSSQPTHPAGADRRPRTLVIAGIATAVAGVVAIGVGGAFEGLAASTSDSLSHPSQGSTFDPNKEKALKTDETAGAVLLAIGGAAVVAGVVTAIIGVRTRRTKHDISFSPSLSPNRIGAVVHASF